MKARFLQFVTLLMVVVLMAGCRNSNEPAPTPEPMPDVEDFKIEILATTPTTVAFRITPRDEQMRYVAMMVEREDFDYFDSEEMYIEDDLYWFEQQAYDEGIDIEEFYARELKQGLIEDTQDTLDPETEYYLYAYGLKTDGTVLTKLHKVAFTTPAVELRDVDFDIEVTDIGYDTAKITVTPEDKNVIYFVNVFSEADYDYWGGDATAFQNHLVYMRNYYLAKGATVEQIIANLASAGQKTITVEELLPGTRYMAYAIAISSDVVAISEASIEPFETPAVHSVDLSFTCEIMDVQYDRVSAVVTPSDDEHTYICSIQSAESLNWYQTEAEFMETIVDDINMWHGGVESALRRGVYTLDEASGLMPNSDYIIVCFGYDKAVTTPLFTAPFTTPAASGEAENLVVEFSISDITRNTVRVTTDPSVGAYYFVTYAETAAFDAKVAELGGEDDAICYFADADIDYGADFFACSRAEYLFELGAILGKYTSYFNQLTPDTEYVAMAIAVDIQTGALAAEHGFLSERFTTLSKVVGSASVEFIFGDYYDGTALAKLNPEKYLNCTGLVVMPYDIVANDDATEWYTGIYANDYWAAGYTDDDIYAELITYGYDMGSSLVAVNSSGGIALLNYDTAYSFLGLAQDAEGNYGVGVLDVVTLSRDGVSAPEEFIAKHDAPQQYASKSALPQPRLLRRSGK